MRVLLFTGAGASVEIGVPAMRSMVEEFHEHLRGLPLESDLFERVDKLLIDAKYDMETLVDLADTQSKALEASEEILGLSVDQSQLDTFRIIRREAEWFVRHVCERIKPGHAALLWGPTWGKSESIR